MRLEKPESGAITQQAKYVNLASKKKKKSAPVMETIFWVVLTFSGFLPELCNFCKFGNLKRTASHLALESAGSLNWAQPALVHFAQAFVDSGTEAGFWLGLPCVEASSGMLAGLACFQGDRRVSITAGREAVRPLETRDWNLSHVPSATFCW